MPQDGFRFPAMFHRRSVIYANSIVETRESLQIQGQPTAEYGHERPLAPSSAAAWWSRWVPIRLRAVDSPCTPLSRRYPSDHGH